MVFAKLDDHLCRHPRQKQPSPLARYGFGVHCQWILDATTVKMIRPCKKKHMAFYYGPKKSAFHARSTAIQRSAWPVRCSGGSGHCSVRAGSGGWRAGRLPGLPLSRRRCGCSGGGPGMRASSPAFDGAIYHGFRQVGLGSGCEVITDVGFSLWACRLLDP